PAKDQQISINPVINTETPRYLCANSCSTRRQIVQVYARLTRDLRDRHGRLALVGLLVGVVLLTLFATPIFMKLAARAGSETSAANFFRQDHRSGVPATLSADGWVQAGPRAGVISALAL